MRHNYFLCAMGVLLMSFGANAEESNRNEVRQNLSSDGWYPVWGHNYTEGDWIEAGMAAFSSIVAENPSIFIEWLEYKWDQNWEQMSGNLPGVLESTVKDFIVESIQDGQIKQIHGLSIQAGFATYNRWENVVYHEPETYECPQYYDYPCPTWSDPFRTCEGWTSSICTRMVEKSYTITLPNWNQFCIRYKLE